MRERFEALGERLPIASRTARGLGLKPDHRGEVRVDGYWLTVDLGDGWRAALRLMPYRGQAVVGELRVFPVDEFPGRGAAQWSAEYLGVRAWERVNEQVRSGITARLLRRVPLGAHLKYARELIEKLSNSGWRDLGERGLHSAQPQRRERADRRPDAFYARIAADYAARIAAGSRRPVADVADKRGLDAAVVRDAVHEARVRGLLTGGRQGAPGGQVTPLAEGLLRKKGGKR